METKISSLLSRTDKVRLRHLIQRIERDTRAEVAVLFVSKVADLEIFATEYFNHVGIGKRGRDNGILVVVALDHRRVRIEVGRGLESAVTPEVAKRIIDDIMAPQFRRRQYGEGLLLSINALGSLMHRV